jgi:hypothetical protein
MHSFAEPKHETNTGAQQLLPLLTHGKSSEIDLHLIIERTKLLSNQSFLNTIQFGRIATRLNHPRHIPAKRRGPTNESMTQA